MDKLTLYKMALSVLDLNPELDSLTPSVSTKELTLMNIYFSKCVLYVLKAWDFPFLIKRAKLTSRVVEEDGTASTWGQFSYGYTLPDNFLKVVRINDDRINAFSVRFGTLWCEVEEPYLEYMENYLETEDVTEGDVTTTVYTAPDDFLSLVAYQLALHIAPLSDPESSAMSVASQLYQITLLSIQESETMNNDHDYNDGANNQVVDEMTRKELLTEYNLARLV
jgi:hypothetical protein